MASGTVGSITWDVNESTGVLTIGGTGEIPRYGGSYGDPPWKSYSSTVKSIVINNGVTKIGEYAFYDLHYVTSVTLAPSTTEYKSHSFECASSAAAITGTLIFYENVTYIGTYAFQYARPSKVYFYGSTAPEIMASGVAFGTNQNRANTKIYTYKGWGNSSTVQVGSYCTATYLPLYIVSYNSQGGSSSPSKIYKGSDESYSLPSPGSKTGYNFAGWYTAATGGTRVGGVGSSYTPSADVTLYAQWSIITYVVTFNANGGTVSPTSASATYGNSVTLPTPTQDGFEFNGWYTAASGGTKIGNAGASYKPTSNITLYAQWTASGTYVFSAKYDRISADQILDNVGKTITTVQNKLHEYITSLGGVTYTNSSGVFSYTIAAESNTVSIQMAASKAANHTGDSFTYMDWKVVTTASAQTYTSYHSLNNIVTSLNALKTHYSSMKGQKVTQVSMAALFMALSSLLSSLVYHRVRFSDKPILRSNINTTAIAGGSVDPTVSVANVTGWATNLSAIAHATSDQAKEVLDIGYSGTNVSSSFTSSSCSSSSSSSCCSSSCSSSSCSSSCSCFFVVFYNLGGM